MKTSIALIACCMLFSCTNNSEIIKQKDKKIDSLQLALDDCTTQAEIMAEVLAED